MRALAVVACALSLAACRSDNYGLVDMARRSPRILRDRAPCWLNGVAAARLDAVQKDLETQGLGLKVWECYRPLSVQRTSRAMVSPHNRGAAVDLTLVRADGAELPMPTPYDDFTPRTHRNFNDLPANVIANRALLEKVMVKHGFVPLPAEWWHFDSEGWESFPLLDIDFARLK